MQPNIFTKVKANPIPFAGAIVVFLIISYAAFNAYQTYEFNKEIDNRQAASQTHVTAAANSTGHASNDSVTRQTEDGVRKQVIAPKLETIRRQSTRSAQNLKVLKQKIKENEKDIRNINANRDLNCIELERRFPNEEFEYCHD